MIRKLLRTERVVDAPAEHEHGPACEVSKSWGPEHDLGLILPIRVARHVLAQMMSQDGWEQQVDRMYVQAAGDGTYNLSFRAAETVDLISNRFVQKTLAAGYDLLARIDACDEDLPDEIVVAAAEFKRQATARQRKSS